MGYGMLLFIFENLASSGVAFSFSFLDITSTIFFFLHIYLTSCLWKATSLPMREIDLASNCVFQLMSSA